ncbi:DUF1127 domain-containing protein [Aliiruegeria lutimaris]|uniref:YjiS-like domain-containing protein n=1 Tax=Aliiruegeria lutimaris TaxID=571298 RepID=A0A1G8XVE9_9RHOB|nr:DUF1127 domain-containing protein [Aliiruegeria lutimaris]SDJ93865.1 protein of unknown function [Aliiruegeria lutimaris]
MEIAANTSRIETGVNASWFSAMVDGGLTKLRQFRAYRRTMDELNTLDDRELADLGLSRAMFRGIAREAALKS